ncbi:cystathionine gamma-synthase [Pseudoclavibacter endophyticus]|uniref:homocysteine desulfhydrase n=1 Tax=Pseudoclavibacter endophyticus TaxID=1778590 RepID=A0A6H9WSL9_9MICO|nr:cystathionine gamma-synthase [Pseudoclavibacter endophyticus]KAB1649927.1 cystathionine gamma-synthase [Pseudoclavibacter endophyticus]
MPDFSPLTRALRTGFESDTTHGAVVPPIYLSSNFTFEGIGAPRPYDYTRAGNPTRDLFGDAVSTLEGGAGGTVVSTGMAAITLAVFMSIRAGDTIVVPHDCYGGSWRLFDSLQSNGFARIETVDLTQTEAALDAIAQIKPALLWLETPSNPLLRISDLRALAEAGHGVGAIVGADNTFLTPLGQRPIELGVDVVAHSATKYLNGHSDVVAGVVVAKTTELHERAAWWANVLGLTGSPFDAYLALRGLRTLDVRWRRHQEVAQAVAEAIEGHDALAAVYYPGLPSHPGHELAASQQFGFGAMLSFELKGGLDAVRRFADGLELFSLAESLGGTESLVAHPATMTHASMTPEAREAAGVSDGLLRLSIGIDAADDLIADLSAALERAR